MHVCLTDAAHEPNHLRTTFNAAEAPEKDGPLMRNHDFLLMMTSHCEGYPYAPRAPDRTARTSANNQKPDEPKYTTAVLFQAKRGVSPQRVSSGSTKSAIPA